MAFPATAAYSPCSYNVNSFLWDGDSLSLGTAGGGAPSALHTLVSAASNFAGKGRFANVAIGGRSVAQMVSAFENTKPHRTKAGHGFLFIWGGAVTEMSSFSDLQSYWALARADGWRVVASTILAQADDAEPDTALKSAFNLAIRSASSEWDFLLDVAAIAELSDPNDPTYFSDAVHLTSLGYQTVAALINSLALPVI